MKLRSEESRLSVTYTVTGVKKDGSACKVTLTITASCAETGSRKAVKDTFDTAKFHAEQGLGVDT